MALISYTHQTRSCKIEMVLIRFQRRLFKDYFAGIYLDRIYSDLRDNTGFYQKAEAINIGLSLSKRYFLQKGGN